MRRTTLSEGGKALLRTVEEAHAKSLASEETFAKLLSQGKQEEAKTYLLAESQQNKTALGGALQKLITFQEEKVKGEIRDAEAASRTAKVWVLSATGFMVLLGGLLAYGITRSITRPLAVVVRAANQVAGGDLTVQIDVTSKDETGQLLDAIRQMVEQLHRIMHHLLVADIKPVYPKQSAYTAEMSARQQTLPANTTDLLQRIPLFTALDNTELASLATNMLPHMFTAAHVIVKQGESSTSMYIVAEGLLYVYIDRPESEDPLKVGQIIPGEFFGEMSLLTGAPRSATVKAATEALVYEITKDTIELVLDKRPEVAESLSQVIAQRHLRNAESMRNLPTEQQDVEMRNFAGQLLDKMHQFFKGFRRSVGV